MALGEHLGADQDAALAAFHPSEQVFHAALAPGGIAVDAHHRVLGKVLAQGLLDALGAAAQGAQVGAAAGRALRVHRPFGPAVMTAQTALALVKGHVRIAAAAIGHPAAVVAQQGGGVAAPVEEQQDLTVLCHMGAHRREQRRGQRVLHGLGAHVQGAQPRHGGAAGAFGQVQAPVAFAVCVVQGLQRGRRRAEHHRHLEPLRPHQGEVARRVAKALLLLEGGVVLLVDDDHAGMGERGEDRRPRADHHGRLAAARGQPGTQTFLVGKPGVQHRDRHLKARPEAAHQLRREADFGDQHQGLAPGPQRVFDDVQVDLGLAAAGDALEQEGTVGPHCTAHGGDRLRLGRRERGRRRAAGGRRETGAVLDRGPALLEQSRHGGPPALQGRVQGRRLGGRGAPLQEGQQRGLARRAGESRRVGRASGPGEPPAADAGAPGRPPLAQQGRQGRADRLAERMVVVSACPAQQGEQLLGQQRGVVEHGERGLQTGRWDLAALRTCDHHAHGAAAPEGHLHAHAGADAGRRDLGRQPVVEGTPQGGGDGYPQDWRRLVGVHGAERITAAGGRQRLVHKNCG